MYGVTLAHAISLKPPSRSRTVKMFTTIGITAILSWPFAAALASVLALQEIADLIWTREKSLQLCHGVVSALAIVALVLVSRFPSRFLISNQCCIVGVDSIAYQRFQVVPINIILYNVFSGNDRGPDIFGTEPWWYYVLNLSLYFNFSFVAALLSLPLQVHLFFTCRSLICYQAFVLIVQKPTGFTTVLRRDMTLVSIYLWIGIFIVQPHKEERFMYVIYPLICYNASHAWSSFMHIFDFMAPKINLSPAFQRTLKCFILWGLALLYLTFSAARVLAQVRGFGAPMQVFAGLESASTVCLGKEWYRFPSSFFIPETSRAMFVKSAFDGLLPGRFPEGKDIGRRSGICKVPTSMNDRNLEEPSHLV
jgi:alpha-1,2-mannosyltransferase